MRIRIPVHRSVHNHFRDFGLRDLALETIGIPKSRTRFAYHRIPPRLGCFVKHRLEGRDTRFQTDQTDAHPLSDIFTSETKVLPLYNCKYHSCTTRLRKIATASVASFDRRSCQREIDLLINIAKITRAKDAQFSDCAIAEYRSRKTAFE